MKSATKIKIVVSSTAFAEGQPIPQKYTEDGESLSPPLAWQGSPPGAKQWAVICDDPDAPTEEPWVHWVLYAIPAATQALPEGVKPSERLDEPTGALQGKNSWTSGRTTGYRGPGPPKGHGVHHYHFKVYALDAELPLRGGATKDDLLKAMNGHIVAMGELMGTYERK